MRIAVPVERRAGEARVALTPTAARKLIAAGAQVIIEQGAGRTADFPDSEYEAAGARIVAGDVFAGADIVLKVRCPLPGEAERLNAGALLVCLLDPFGEGCSLFEGCAARGVSVLALERIPRITRAQTMDVLSSQANIAGYRAALEAATRFRKLVPMMMTAAGSVPPARAFVLGVGVAGLQVIATLRRLGAAVEAFDVRPEVREQIVSVGAKVLDLGIEESGAGEGGYARELSEEGKARQRAALTRELARADIVVTTALIPGRPAPELVTEQAVRSMRPGSVVVDMAAAAGGNCALTEPDQVVERHGVTLVGFTNYPALVAHHASQFFARNLLALLELIVTPEEGSGAKRTLNVQDEILDAALVVHEGAVRWSPPKGASA
jgi:NAD(P) transhydrogenase subunit alpha